MATALRGQALTTGVTTLFDSATDGKGVIGYFVSNLAASAGYALISISGLVTDFPLAPGTSQVFRLGKQAAGNSISTITAKSVSTSTVDAGVVAKA